MNQMAQMLNRFEYAGLFATTHLNGVRLFKSVTNIPRTPLLYPPGICIVAQGAKVGHIGGRSFTYDAENYLVASVPIPFECETFTDHDNPLLGLYIDIDMTQLHGLIAQMDGPPGTSTRDHPAALQGIGPSPMDDAFSDAVMRLLNSLHSKEECDVLGPCLIRDILFRALHGGQAPMLYALAAYKSTHSLISQALHVIHEHYADKIEVEHLAKALHMSTSAFHRAFKEVTSDSPMQYIKKVRLLQAKEYIVYEGAKANHAAMRVGYASASQFSREFKRYFGVSPSEMAQNPGPL